MADQTTSDGSRFSYDNVGIAELLATKRFEVPIYQRPYSWSDDKSSLRDQVQEFWDDLVQAKAGNEEYFLGTVVVARQGATGNGKLLIVDGQQRLATTAILLAALREIYKEKGDQSRGDVVQQGYLAKPDLKTNQGIPQLRLNGEDEPYFGQFIIQGDRTTSTERESHRDIERAYHLLANNLRTIASKAGDDWTDKLSEWPVFLTEKVRVIRVEVPTEAEAFTIFETLNDRGADLTISDLLKILLFSRSGESIESVRENWVATMANLDVASEGGQIFNDFLRTYWSSKHGATRERALYSKIRDEIQGEQKVAEFASELERSARTYHALLNPTAANWKTHSASTVKHLETLLTLKLEQNRPLLLACASKMSKARFAELVERLVSWSVRGLILGGIGGGTAERLYCEAAIEVWDGTIKTPDEVQNGLGSIIHSDAAFKTKFATATVSRPPLARYLLHVLERQAIGEDEPELVPNKDAADVNLEHILPQTPSQDDWPDFTVEQAREYRNRIGNLALMQGTKNSQIGRQPFSGKRSTLANSSLILTQEAGKQKSWTPKEIEDRQTRLADLAVTAWPL